MSKEAMKLALEALENHAPLTGKNAITALREALVEQPAQTDWEAVAADQAMTIALLKAEQPAQRCPLCNYQHGHAIGCKNNPVDIALNKMAENARELGLDYAITQTGVGIGKPMSDHRLMEQPAQPAKLKVTLEDRPIDIELARYKRMFESACSALAQIGDALGCDPEEGGAEPILAAIAELKAEQPAQQEPVYFCDYGYEGWGKVDAAMAAENLACGMTVEAYYTSPSAQRKPLTDEQIHEIYDAVARQEPYMGAVTRRNIVRAIEAAHGITGETK